LDKKDRIKTFTFFVKGVLSANVPDKTKIEVIKKELEELE